MSTSASGTFDIELTPAPPELDGGANRLDFRKSFHGDLEGSGTGVMLSGGDPSSGSAGYAAFEVVRGTLQGRSGSFALVQLALMQAGTQTLHYEVVPGSGTDELVGITGSFHLTIDEDGTHRFELVYDL